MESFVPILNDVQIVDGKLIYSLNTWVGKKRGSIKRYTH